MPQLAQALRFVIRRKPRLAKDLLLNRRWRDVRFSEPAAPSLGQIWIDSMREIEERSSATSRAAFSFERRPQTEFSKFSDMLLALYYWFAFYLTSKLFPSAHTEYGAING